MAAAVESWKRSSKYSYDLHQSQGCAYTIVGMGTDTGRYYARDAKREFRRRRLQALAYVGLAALAAVTVVVVVLALQR